MPNLRSSPELRRESTYAYQSSVVISALVACLWHQCYGLILDFSHITTQHSAVITGLESSMSATVGAPKRHRGNRLGERRGNREATSSQDASEEGKVPNQDYGAEIIADPGSCFSFDALIFLSFFSRAIAGIPIHHLTRLRWEHILGPTVTSPSPISAMQTMTRQTSARSSPSTLPPASSIPSLPQKWHNRQISMLNPRLPSLFPLLFEGRLVRRRGMS